VNPEQHQIIPEFTNLIQSKSNDVLGDITKLINVAKSHVAREYNSSQVLLSWFIGK